MGGVAPRLKLLGPLSDLPESPGGELMLYLAARPGWRGWEEIGELIPGRAEALRAIQQSPYGAWLVIRGREVRLEVESDLLTFWREAYRSPELVNREYGILAEGFQSPLPGFMTWLERERSEILHTAWGTALGLAGRLWDQGRRGEALVVIREVEGRLPLEYRAALDLADLYWRLCEPADTARVLRAAMPYLPEDIRRQAELNLGAALLRTGRLDEGRSLLGGLEDSEDEPACWAGLHLGEAQAFSGETHAALVRAERALAFAKVAEDGPLAVSALLLTAEVRLRLNDAPAALSVAAEAFSIQESLGRAFSPVSLAVLAEAQAGTGHSGKARKTAEAAYRKARETHDPYAASRALFALWRATKTQGYLKAAQNEAEGAGHAPWRTYLCEIRATSG